MPITPTGRQGRQFPREVIVCASHSQLALNSGSSFPQWSQFSEGLSIWSITNKSTGPLAGTSFKPSCS